MNKTIPTVPIPIALVITDLHIGGAERALVELATRLDRSKFAPVVYCLLPPPPPQQSALVEALHAADVRIEFLNARGWWSLPRVVGALWRSFSRQRPRLVQGFLLHANVVGAVAAWLAGVPVMVGGIRVAEPRTAHLRLMRWIDCLVQQYVCVSRCVADYSDRIGRLPQDKLLVIPNGIDGNRFADVTAVNLHEFGIKQGGRAIAFVGRLTPQKGLDWLLPQLAGVFEQAPAYDLLVVGHGPARTMLERRAQTLNLHERVHFVGWQANIPAVLAASEILVLPSRWEGMPNAVLEAMAAGKPVVACDVEGIRELLGPHATEQTASPDDANAFTDCLLALLKNPQLRMQLGESNRHRAASEFGIEAMVGRYESLYTSLLSAAFQDE